MDIIADEAIKEDGSGYEAIYDDTDGKTVKGVRFTQKTAALG